MRDIYLQRAPTEAALPRPALPVQCPERHLFPPMGMVVEKLHDFTFSVRAAKGPPAFTDGIRGYGVLNAICPPDKQVLKGGVCDARLVFGVVAQGVVFVVVGAMAVVASAWVGLRHGKEAVRDLLATYYSPVVTSVIFFGTLAYLDFMLCVVALAARAS